MYKDRRFCHCWSGSLQMNVMAKWIIAREKSFLFRTIANLCLPILHLNYWGWELAIAMQFWKGGSSMIANQIEVARQFQARITFVITMQFQWAASLMATQNSKEEMNCDYHTMSEEHNRQSVKHAQTTKGPMFLLHIDKHLQLHTKQNSAEKSLLLR
jgi:hypothetical protein